MQDFTIGNVWSECFDFFQRNLVSLLVLVGGATLVGQIIMVYAFGASDGAMQSAAEQFRVDPNTAKTLLLPMLPGFFIGSYLQAVGGMAALRVGLSGEKNPTSAVTYGLGATLVLIAFYIGLGFIIAIPIGLIVAVFGSLAGSGGSAMAAMGVIAIFLLFMIPVIIWVSIRLILITPTMAAARSYNPIDALKASWRLTGPVQWQILGLFLMYIIALIVVSMIVGIFAMIFTVIGGTTFGGFVSGTLTGMISQIGNVVLGAGILRAVTPHHPGDVFA